MTQILMVGGLMRLDILVWVVGLPLLAVAMVFLFYQYRNYRKLREEVRLLSQMKRHTIEYELVLKAMKLSVWRIDVPTKTITYESDYREATDNPVVNPETDVTVFCNTLLPSSYEAIHQGIMNMVEGRMDEFHAQYQMRQPHSNLISWGEVFATIDKRDENGKPVTIVGTSMNIDKQKEIEQALIEARNHAEESDRLKSAFLANMSHEIRTPLNAIVGFSDVLPLAQSEEERNQLLSLIKQNNAHLLRLFDDLVNMSKLEAGGEAVKKTRFDLNVLLAEVVDKYVEKSQMTGVKLVVESKSEVPELFTDRVRLREILNQYVNNAMKFTTEGSVTLGYDMEDNQLRVWVRDTGKGIPQEHCGDHLFERFVKVDEFVPGTGLGLSICRSLASSLGGTVGVESTLGKGSLFWVKLAME